MASVKEVAKKLATPTVLSLAITAVGLMTTAGVALGVLYLAKHHPAPSPNPPEPAEKAQTEYADVPMFIGA